MKKTLLRGLAVTGAALLASAAFAPVASAHGGDDHSHTYQTNLTALNKSGASGTATLTLTGNNLTVDMRVTGLTPNVAHVQHLHVGGSASCPATTADSDKDGYVSAREAESATGPVKISLTTGGDVSTSSALAIDRYPKANGQGVVTYKRTFALPSGIAAADLSRATIDVHGIGSLFNNRSQYDGDKKSELDNKLAFEATVPAACGKLTATPAGGPNTGLGSTAGIESPLAIIFGAVALTAAAGLYFYNRRPVVSSRI